MHWKGTPAECADCGNNCCPGRTRDGRQHGQRLTRAADRAGRIRINTRDWQHPALAYLNLLVDDIVVTGREATIKGSNAALMAAAAMDEKKRVT